MQLHPYGFCKLPWLKLNAHATPFLMILIFLSGEATQIISIFEKEKEPVMVLDYLLPYCTRRGISCLFNNTIQSSFQTQTKCRHTLCHFYKLLIV